LKWKDLMEFQYSPACSLLVQPCLNCAREVWKTHLVSSLLL